MIINQYVTDGLESGGSRHFDLARKLVQAGHSVLLIGGRPRVTTKTQERSGVHYLWLRVLAYRGNGLKRFVSMIGFGVVAALSRPDYEPNVVIGSSVHPFAALAGWVQARRFGVPFVFEVRDLWPESLVQLGGYSRRHPVIVLLYMLEKFLYEKASAVVTVLPSAREYITARGVPAEHVRHIPNGVDLERFGPHHSPRVPDANEPLRVMYAGTHGLANNLTCLIEAARLLELRQVPVSFLLVGDGPQKPALIRRVREYGLTSVEFRPPVPRSEIPGLLASADAFCILGKSVDLYRYGISPNKLFDYMAAARPIVFSRNTSPNIVREADAGFTVPPDNPEALAEAIVQLSRLTPAERAAMGMNARRYVEQHHSMDVLGKQLEELLVTLTAQARPALVRQT